MHDLLLPVAEAFNAVLPDWARVPSLTFAMPHAAYWLGLILFPPLAAWLVQREARRADRERVTAPIAYLLWLTAGFAGLHRFYLRAPRMGLAYVALFLLVLYGNRQASLARNFTSAAANDLKGAEFEIEHFTRLVERGSETAQARVDQARAAAEALQAKLAGATAVLDQWQALAGGLALVIGILLVVDAVLIPRLKRRCLAREAGEPAAGIYQVMARGREPGPRDVVQTPFIRVVDALNGLAGQFVAYWSVVAVFVYYFEVLARYVFNSPTNWAHESMFLMFGMQYLLSGGFALRDDAHVRVDVIYERLTERAKAWTEIVTSFFFFVFAGTLMVTGWIFARDAIDVWEVSFTEWAIQYWPVKLTIALGAALILLQGLAKLTRDVAYLGRLRTG